LNLSDIASIVEIVGIVALAYGLYFGAMQLRQHRRQQRDLAILECARWFEDREFTEAYLLIQGLPTEMSAQAFSELEERYRTAAVRIAMKFETIGLLVHRGVIPLDAMEELVGGAALATWRVLEKFVAETREQGSNPTFMEWFQWLVEHMKNRDPASRQPAFVAYADWDNPLG